MTQLSTLQLSMYLDGALDEDERQAVEALVAESAEYRAQLSALQAEKQALMSALQIETETVVVPSEVPKFSAPLSFRQFALANIATGLAIWLGQFLWKTLFGEMLMNAVTWLTSIYVPDVYQVVNAAMLYLIREGTAMLDTYLVYILLGVSLTAVAVVALYFRRRQAAAGLCLALLATGVSFAPQRAEALEFRQSEDVVRVEADEVVDDTLVVAADTVVIEGRVTGDLVVAARRIEVKGSVEGNTVTFGETVQLRGVVNGMSMAAASSITLNDARVAGDLWVAGNNMSIDEGSAVEGNAMAAGQTLEADGTIGKDLYGFGETVEVGGRVGADVESFANRLRLLDSAVVTGDVRLRSDNPNGLDQAAGAQVGGTVEQSEMPEELKETNSFLSIEFYLWLIAGLVASLLVGLVLFWLFPSLRQLSLSGGVDGVKTAGVGLLAMIVLPMAAALLAITLIGLPFAFAGIVLWLTVLFLADIVVGFYIGRQLLSGSASRDSVAIVLLVGLLVVVVASNLPFIGGIIAFVLTILGVGMLVQYLMDVFSSRQVEV